MSSPSRLHRFREFRRFIYPTKLRTFELRSSPFSGTPATEQVAFYVDILSLSRILFGLFFVFELPRLNHDSFVQFGADPPTYWQAVDYRSEHPNTGGTTLISFTGNLLGPVAIGTLLGNRVAVAWFKILLFFVAVEIACSVPGVDKYRLLFPLPSAQR